MAIAKVNGLPKASIGKVNGLEKANINKISALTASFVQHAANVSTSIGAADNGLYRTIMCYDTNASRVVVAYQSVGDNHGESRVGKIAAGGAISWGTAVEFDQGTTSTGIKPLCMQFNANTNKIHIVYNSYDTGGTNNYKVYSKIGTVDNTDDSITWSPSGNLSDGTGQLETGGILQGQAVYHPDATKMYWHWVGGNNRNNVNHLTDSTSDPAHTALSTQQPFGDNTSHWSGIVYAAVNSLHRLIVAADDDSVVNLVCGTVESDDDDVSWGSLATVVSASSDDIVVGWDSDNEKGLVLYTDSNSYGKFATFTVDTDDNAITVNSGTDEAGFFMSSAINSVNIMYNTDANHFVVAYRNDDALDDIHFKTATLNSSNNQAEWSSNDSTGGIVIYTGSSSNEGRSTEITYSPANHNMANYPDATPGVLVCWWRDGPSGVVNSQGYVTRLANLGTNYDQTAG
jgi:hypothetical protein